MKKYKYIVYIGRFQPCHLAHIEIMRRALEMGERLIILVGSAMQPRTIENPWTWVERADMIKASLPDTLKDRVVVMPLRDILYNDQQWARQVQEIVTAIATTDTTNEEIKLIGHKKDDTSFYLSMFPQWGDPIEVENIEDIHAADIRKGMFDVEGDIDFDFDLTIGRNLPTPIHNYLQAFTMKDEYERLVGQWAFIKNYKKAWEGSPYQPIFQTVDAVVLMSGHVLLVRRRAEPGLGLYALPGGFVNPNERLYESVVRELREETKIKLPEGLLLGKAMDQQPKVFDHPKRSLRGRTITNAFLFELPPGPLPKVKGADDADKAKWVPLSVFAKMEEQLFEDHYHIITHFVN